jgi:PBP1b-binding outer membrane lipoprotein LpoB
MKKVKVIATLALTSLLLTGCGKTMEMNIDKSADETAPFVIVEICDFYNIVYNKDTRVMYTVSKATNNIGNFTVMLNADGTPMLYED